MFKSKKKSARTQAFTLIELLVVVAIIGILATLAVVALQQARSRARDSKRVADMKQIQTALELFYNENNRYPKTEEFVFGEALISSSTGNILMNQIPTAPIPADRDCDEYDNYYNYIPKEDTSSYALSFCTGKEVSSLPTGIKFLTPGGVSQDYFSCGDLLAYKGQNYKTVQIGSQCWMAENLNYDNGCSSVVWENTIDKAWCGYYENDKEIYGSYGLLYQWSTAMNGNTTEASQGICPNGWHIPSDNDWYILENFVDPSIDNPSATGFRGIDAGKKLKSCRQVNSPLGDICQTSEHPRWSDHDTWLVYGTDDFSFSGLPGGNRNTNNSLFLNIGLGSRWWSSTEVEGNETYVWRRYQQYLENRFGRGTSLKSIGFPIRCIKD